MSAPTERASLKEARDKDRSNKFAFCHLCGLHRICEPAPYPDRCCPLQPEPPPLPTVRRIDYQDSQGKRLKRYPPDPEDRPPCIGPRDEAPTIWEAILSAQSVARWKQYQNKGISRDDLLSAAYEGLAEARIKHNPHLGSLASFAIPRMRKRITKLFDEQDKYQKLLDACEQELGSRHSSRRWTPGHSSELEIADGGEAPTNALAGSGPGDYDFDDKLDLRDAIARCRARGTLSSTDSKILDLRFGRVDGKDHTIAEVSVAMNLSRSTVKEILKRCFDIIRDDLK